jgi:hypothetical protein
VCWPVEVDRDIVSTYIFVYRLFNDVVNSSDYIPFRILMLQLHVGILMIRTEGKSRGK